MKNLKLTMIAALVSISLAAFPNTLKTMNQNTILEIPPLDGGITKNVTHIYVTTQQATQIPGLVDAILEKYDRSMLGTESKLFTIKVRHLNYLFHVSGTYENWMWLFNHKTIRLENNKQKIIL